MITINDFPTLSLYIHIPWCIQKCPYCDFNSHTLKHPLPDKAYVDHLLNDLRQDLQDFPELKNRHISSIFIGGGTPSLLTEEAIAELLSGVKAQIAWDDNVEITMEANPGTVDSQHFNGYFQAGINRLSIGVQSFNDNHLKRLGRIHSAQEAINVIKRVHELKLPRFNLDLMHGLPEQNREQALDDLKQAVELTPPHLSWYQLTIEPNTLFGSRPPVLPDDDMLWEIFHLGQKYLREQGYQQYETSAYAKPGFQCQHNLNYWRFGDYLGIGCGAHGKITGADRQIHRTIKVKHPKGYLQGHYLDKRYVVEQSDLPFEFFMNRFRLIEPTPREDFLKLTGLHEEMVKPQIEEAIKKGYLEQSQTHWHITHQGQLFLNSLLEIFL